MSNPPFSDKAPKKYPPPFSMRFTIDERRALELAAAGRPLASYIRWLIFKEDMPELPKRRTRETAANPDRQELAKLLGTLGKSRISQNINQLAKAANSGSLPVNQEVIEELNDACKAINWLRDTLIKAIGLKSQSEPKLTQEENNYDPQR